MKTKEKIEKTLTLLIITECDLSKKLGISIPINYLNDISYQNYRMFIKQKFWDQLFDEVIE